MYPTEFNASKLRKRNQPNINVTDRLYYKRKVLPLLQRFASDLISDDDVLIAGFAVIKNYHIEEKERIDVSLPLLTADYINRSFIVNVSQWAMDCSNMQNWPDFIFYNDLANGALALTGAVRQGYLIATGEEEYLDNAARVASERIANMANVEIGTDVHGEIYLSQWQNAKHFAEIFSQDTTGRSLAQFKYDQEREVYNLWKKKRHLMAFVPEFRMWGVELAFQTYEGLYEIMKNKGFNESGI